MGQIEINHTGSGGGIVLSSDGTDLLLGGSAIGGGGGASAYTIDAKTDNYTAVAGDLGKLIHFTSISADKTLTLTAAATLGAGWFCYVRYSAIASGAAGYAYKVTIDPNGSETIDGTATRRLYDGGTFQIVCDGSNFQIISSDESRAIAHNIFYNSVGIINLDIYFDPDFKLVKTFKMRGMPTSILINKNGMEFARIVGEIDFSEKSFTDFLKKYN